MSFIVIPIDGIKRIVNVEAISSVVQISTDRSLIVMADGGQFEPEKTFDELVILLNADQSSYSS